MVCTYVALSLADTQSTFTLCLINPFTHTSTAQVKSFDVSAAQLWHLLVLVCFIWLMLPKLNYLGFMKTVHYVTFFSTQITQLLVWASSLPVLCRQTTGALMNWHQCNKHVTQLFHNSKALQSEK